MGSSHIDLPLALEPFNKNGRLNHIIERAKNYGYHDFKFDCVPDHPEYADCNTPKIQLVKDLSRFPELDAIRKDVINGKYDDTSDETDKARMRAILLSEHASDNVFVSILGQDAPTKEEREKFKLQSKLN
jgi:hypothetical protein